jgi:hypothetical protein
LFRVIKAANQCAHMKGFDDESRSRRTQLMAALPRMGPMGRSMYVYILASKSRRLYIGVTNDLVRRIWEHKEGVIVGFTKRYGIKQLVYYETISGPR